MDQPSSSTKRKVVDDGDERYDFTSTADSVSDSDDIDMLDEPPRTEAAVKHCTTGIASSTTSSSTSSSSTTKKRAKYTQTFCDNWLSDPCFSSWLNVKKELGKSYPYCKYCKTKIGCAKTSLVRHAATKSHQEASKMHAHLEKSQPKINSAFSTSRNSEGAAKMEIKIASFLVENNLPISLSDDFLALLRSLFPNDCTLKHVTLGKQKATNTIRQVLGFHYAKEGIDQLKENKFSLIIDETTDKSTTSQMAVMGIYFDKTNFRMNNVLVDVISMPDGKANTIYRCVVECLREKGIPMRNVIGYCSDTCNVMFGAHHSVSQLLTENFPWIIPVKCSCHLIHLCASKAAMKLPKSLEDLCRNIHSHFSLSSQRCDAFKEFQEFLNIEKHQILRSGQTRWLSMKQCIDRILEQYDALKLYFQGLALNDPTHTNDSILKSLNNKYTLAYMEFMAFELGRLTDFNKLFQSDIPLLHALKEEVSKLVSALAGDFLKLSYLRQRSSLHIDVNDHQYHVPLSQVYVGVKATQTINEIVKDIGKDHPDIQLFYKHCKDFLMECVTQILSRFSGLDKLDFLTCLSPSVAFNLTMPSLSPVFQQLSYISDVANSQDTDTEWRKQALDPLLNGNLPLKEYWQHIFHAKDDRGSPVYPNLTKVISVLLSLPFSNATVERVFSQLKLIKTDHRASLKQESLLGLMVTKLAFKQKGKQHAANLEPSKEMIRLHKRMESNADDEEACNLRKTFYKSIQE